MDRPLAKGLAAGTIQNFCSVLRAFSEWIEKPGLVPSTRVLEEQWYLKGRITRVNYAMEDKSWSGAGINVDKKIREIAVDDYIIGVQLNRQRYFGLRMKESCLLKPQQADMNSYLDVSWGTKNGRPRVVPIRTKKQREVLEQAKLLAPKWEGSLVPRNKTFSQWRDHHRYVLYKHGISKDQLGVASHGLRHEYASEEYERDAGHPSPVKGGDIKEYE